jgi:hypothetical protein
VCGILFVVNATRCSRLEKINRVKGLSNVLRDIEDTFLEHELTVQQEAELQDIANGCKNDLSTLQVKLTEYRELDSTNRTRRVWKRLKWEPEDIRELRSRITSNISLLNAFNARINR